MKLKENIDLKVLKELGFKNNHYYHNYLKFLVDTDLKIDVISIDTETREIKRTIKEYMTPHVVCKKVKTQYIKDLIEKGLVEQP